MAVLEKLEKKFRRVGIPNITLYLVGGQAIVYMFGITEQIDITRLLLIPANVLRGEVWRLFTFIFMPSFTNPVFMLFALYLFYLMGTALENYWGTFRYNVFLLIGYAATVAVAFLTPNVPASNIFLGGSIFLAFATLNPDFELAIFFILPVKIKWLALLTWIGYIFQIVVGSWTTRFMVLASICNYLVFFSRDIWSGMKTHRWRMERKAQEFARQNEPIHRCTACGRTDKDHPTLTFRYCTQCAGTPCYCQDHLKNHDHLTAPS